MLCQTCNRTFKSIKSLRSHEWRAHSEKGKLHCPAKGISNPWNKGLTKSDPRVLAHALSVSKTMKDKEYGPLPDSQKRKISESMKIAHAEGRAHNIGKCRWNNEPSYPEIFFMKVIDNEFEDKNYVREMQFFRYSLDFAWPHKKRCIEIDGEQHQKDEKQKERDIKKDKLLLDNGWKIIRIQWKDMYRDPKRYIEKAKEFINDPAEPSR